MQRTGSEDPTIAHEEEAEAEYIRTIGILQGSGPDEVEVLHFLVDALKGAPLPPPWVANLDEENRMFFANTVTLDTSWNHPYEDSLKELGGVCRVCLALPMSLRESCIEKLIRRWEDDAKLEFGKWFAAQDEETGGEYFYHADTGEAMWEHPLEVVLPRYYFKIRSAERLRDEEYVATLSQDGARKLPNDTEIMLRKQQREQEQKEAEPTGMPLLGSSVGGFDCQPLSPSSATPPFQELEDLSVARRTGRSNSWPIRPQDMSQERFGLTMTALQEALAKQTGEESELLKQKEQLEEDKEELKNQLREVLDSRLVLQQQLEKAEAHLAELKASHETHAEELKKAQAEFQTAQALVAQSNQASDDSVGKLGNLESKYETLLQELKALQEARSATEASYKEALEKAKEADAKLTQKEADLRSTKEDLEKQLAEARALAETLNQQVGTLDTELSVLRKERNEWTAKEAHYEEELVHTRALGATASSFQEAAETAEANVAALHSKFEADLQTFRQELEQKLEEALAVSEKYQRQVSDLDTELCSLRESKSQWADQQALALSQQVLEQGVGTSIVFDQEVETASRAVGSSLVFDEGLSAEEVQEMQTRYQEALLKAQEADRHAAAMQEKFQAELEVAQSHRQELEQQLGEVTAKTHLLQDQIGMLDNELGLLRQAKADWESKVHGGSLVSRGAGSSFVFVTKEEMLEQAAATSEILPPEAPLPVLPSTVSRGAGSSVVFETKAERHERATATSEVLDNEALLPALPSTVSRGEGSSVVFETKAERHERATATSEVLDNEVHEARSIAAQAQASQEVFVSKLKEADSHIAAMREQFQAEFGSWQKSQAVLEKQLAEAHRESHMLQQRLTEVDAELRLVRAAQQWEIAAGASEVLTPAARADRGVDSCVAAPTGSDAGRSPKARRKKAAELSKCVSSLRKDNSLARTKALEAGALVKELAEKLRMGQKPPQAAVDPLKKEVAILRENLKSLLERQRNAIQLAIVA